MEPSKKKNFFSQNTLFGLFVGLSFIAVAYAYYRSGRGVSLNPQLNNVILLLSIVGGTVLSEFVNTGTNCRIIVCLTGKHWALVPI